MPYRTDEQNRRAMRIGASVVIVLAVFLGIVVYACSR